MGTPRYVSIQSSRIGATEDGARPLTRSVRDIRVADPQQLELRADFLCVLCVFALAAGGHRAARNSFNGLTLPRELLVAPQPLPQRGNDIGVLRSLIVLLLCVGANVVELRRLGPAVIGRPLFD